MRKVKCLEYYFKPNVTREQIDEEIEENIKKLRRISKIIDTKIEIQTNEIGMQIVRAYIVQEEKKSILSSIKNKIQEYIDKKPALTLPETGKTYNQKSEKINIVEKLKDVLRQPPQITTTGMPRKIYNQKQNYTQNTKYSSPSYYNVIPNYSTNLNTNVKIEMEMQVKKYGNYKPGGTFKPYESKKKKRQFINKIPK